MDSEHIKENGIVYTPTWIVNLILDHVGYKKNIYDKKIIDPACGDGAFLAVVVERLIDDARKNKIADSDMSKLLQSNIFGFDIEEKAVFECKANLDKIAKSKGLKNIKWQIAKADSLDRQHMENFISFFDFVVGNPPYIRIQHLGEKRRKILQTNWQLCKSGSTDIFIAFFELGFALLNDKGHLGYITPNTYLKTRTAQSLRQFIKESHALKTLIDFGHNQLFENATTYSLITILDKAHKQPCFQLYKGSTYSVDYIDVVDVNNLKSDNWVLADNTALERLKSIEMRGLPLGEIADIHVGVTTLTDGFYIFKDPIFDGNKATIQIKDGRSFTIEKSILKPIIKASVLKESDKPQNRYIIFPYEKRAGKHVIMEEKNLENKFPLTYEYFHQVKPYLDKRDKGRPCAPTWYAFGRAQGLDTSFGPKILTSPMNLKPNFIPWNLGDYTFYAGYCVKFKGNLNLLAEKLNSEDMEFYISHMGRDYQNNYKSFAKSFIENFGLSMPNMPMNLKPKQMELV